LADLKGSIELLANRDPEEARKIPAPALASRSMWFYMLVEEAVVA
jgi:hypothetical protein